MLYELIFGFWLIPTGFKLFYLGLKQRSSRVPIYFSKKSKCLFSFDSTFFWNDHSFTPKDIDSFT